MTEPADILLIAPHPDDPEMGAGGSVAIWAKEGKRVVYIICTNGDKGTSDTNIMPKDLAKIREKEQLAAAKVLGVKEVIFLGYPDQGLEDTPEFRKELVRQIRKYRPETVATTDPYRKYIWHRDHRICGQVTLDAIFPYARDFHAYPDLIKEGLAPHKIKRILFWGSDDCNMFVDICETFATKLEAVSCHKSQFGNMLSQGMIERLKQRACDLAAGKPFNMAEAFHLVEIPR